MKNNPFRWAYYVKGMQGFYPKDSLLSIHKLLEIVHLDVIRTLEVSSLGTYNLLTKFIENPPMGSFTHKEKRIRNYLVLFEAQGIWEKPEREHINSLNIIRYKKLKSINTDNRTEYISVNLSNAKNSTASPSSWQ